MLLTSKADFACGSTELPVICFFSPLPRCNTRCLQQVLAQYNLSQKTAYPRAALPTDSMTRVLLHYHVISLKIWNNSRMCVSSLRRRQQTADLCAGLPISSMASVLLDGHFILLKIWNASRICMWCLPRGHPNLLCMASILIYVLP